MIQDKTGSALAARIATTLLVMTLAATLLANYISSWLPGFGGLPAGAILRDVLVLLLVILGMVAAHPLRPHIGLPAPARQALVALALLTLLCVLLIRGAPSLVAGISASRNLVLYALCGVAVAALIRRGWLDASFIVTSLVVAGALAGLLGIADTLSHGGIVDALGFRRDYSGVAGADARLIAGAAGQFGGIVRASGGITNALGFGYLMVVVAGLAAWRLASGWAAMPASLRAFYFAAAVVAVVATVCSLTRGAWIALVVTLAILLLFRPSVRTLGVVGSLVVAALAAVIGITVFTAVPGATPPAQAEASPGPLASQQVVASRPTGGILSVVTDRIGSSDSTSIASSAARVDQLKEGLARLRASPLGTGLASEGAASERAGTFSRAAAPDIYVLIVALQTGLPGLILWLAAVAAAATWAVRNLSDPLAPLVLMTIALLGIASVLSATPDAPQLSLPVWIVLLGLAGSSPIWLQSPGAGTGDNRLRT